MATTVNGDNVDVPGLLTTAQFKVTGGTPAIGKTLVSDAAGVATWQPAGTGSQAHISWPIANGVDTEVVTGLGLSFVPTRAICTIRRPAGEDMMYANTVTGSFSADGFTFILSGVTTSANYILDATLS